LIHSHFQANRKEISLWDQIVDERDVPVTDHAEQAAPEEKPEIAFPLDSAT
jgi:hypothetical protein